MDPELAIYFFVSQAWSIVSLTQSGREYTAPMTGILAVFNDVAGGETAEVEFNNWYNQQHLLERIGVAGFSAGYRYRAVDASHRYFAWYETAWPSVMRSSGYVDRLEDPTAWTARVMPGFTNMVRTVANRTSRAGEGTGAAAATVHIARSPNGEAGSGLDAMVEEVFAHVLAKDGVISIEHWLADVGLSHTDTTESRMRGGEDKTFDGLLMIQGMDTHSLQAVTGSMQDELNKLGFTVDGKAGIWQLLFTAQRGAQETEIDC